MVNMIKICMLSNRNMANQVLFIIREGNRIAVMLIIDNQQVIAGKAITMFLSYYVSPRKHLLQSGSTSSDIPPNTTVYYFCCCAVKMKH